MLTTAPLLFLYKACDSTRELVALMLKAHLISERGGIKSFEDFN